MGHSKREVLEAAGIHFLLKNPDSGKRSPKPSLAPSRNVTSEQ